MAIHLKSSMRVSGLLATLLFLSVKTAFGQSSDMGSWHILNLKYTHSDKMSLFAEGQIRSLKFYDDFHYYEVKAGINYKIHKAVKISLGAGSYQTFKEGGNFQLPKNNNEFRLWPQLVLFQEIDRLKIEQRYRTEMRWTSNGYRNRFRYRLGISYPFGKQTKGYQPFQISLNNELFFTDNEPYFERNRVQLTLNYKTSKNATLQLGYLQQFDFKINDEIGRDFLVLGYYYEIFRKSYAQAVHEHELKDN